MLEAKNIVKSFTYNNMKFNAVDDVSFTLYDGEFCSLVGESGSGKSTLAQILCGLIPTSGGEVVYNGNVLTPQTRTKNTKICADIQLVLQNGKAAIDPHFTVYDCISEPLKNLTALSKKERDERVGRLMDMMELPQEMLKRKAHQLSGGQQKRICIVRALAANPKTIIFDEAVSGLDVVVRKNILDILIKLQKERNMSFLFITHDIDVALYTSKRIAVMRNGKLLEQVSYSGNVECFTAPYSKLLLKSAMICNE